MSVTPEGKVKKVVRKLLDSFPNVYYAMPVQGGYGAALLDFYGHCSGDFFAIETKAPGKKLTPRQEMIVTKIEASGGMVFVIDSEDGLGPLKIWLEGE
jgi:hypothetical protein